MANNKQLVMYADVRLSRLGIHAVRIYCKCGKRIGSSPMAQQRHAATCRS